MRCDCDTFRFRRSQISDMRRDTYGSPLNRCQCDGDENQSRIETKIRRNSDENMKELGHPIALIFMHKIINSTVLRSTDVVQHFLHNKQENIVKMRNVDDEEDDGEHLEKSLPASQQSTIYGTTSCIEYFLEF